MVVSWMVVESKLLLLIDDAKSSVGICRHPFEESDRPVGIYSIEYIYLDKPSWSNWLSIHAG